MGTTGKESGPRQDSDVQGRDRLLEAARQLVFDQFETGMPLGAIFAHITPLAIADVAGVSRALIYHYWPADPDRGITPMDLLLTEVLQSVFDREGQVEELRSDIRKMPDSLGEVLQDFSDQTMDLMAGPETGNAWRVRTILNLCGAPLPFDTATAVDPTSLDELSPGELSSGEPLASSDGTDLHQIPAEQLTNEQWLSQERGTPFYAGLDLVHADLLTKFGRRMRAPLQIRDLTVALVSYTDGIGIGVINAGGRLTRTHEWSPHIAVGGPEQPHDGWTLFAIGAEALIAGLTEPVPT